MRAISGTIQEKTGRFVEQRAREIGVALHLSGYGLLEITS